MDGDAAPMGANLTSGGATFRVWAPNARSVGLRGSFTNGVEQPLAKIANGHWYAFVPGVKAGDRYKLFVTGAGSAGDKRDPWARALTVDPPFPLSDCIVTTPAGFPWHDQAFRPPKFNDLVIYQLHVGAFYSVDAAGRDQRTDRPGRFLDVMDRVEYLRDLGVNAIQLLPVQEFPTARSLGYNGTDFYSPEMAYTMAPGDAEFARLFAKANDLLARRGLPGYRPGDLDGQTAQLMALVDVCHAYGLAVILDVVYNHAGGDFGDQSLYFMDRQPFGDNNRSLYFTDQGWAGGLVFAFWNGDVRQFLIDNGRFFFDEYHVDGFRFDEVTVIDRFGGWTFLQDLTDTLRYARADAPLIAEYWGDQSAVLRSRHDGGAGFDAVIDSGLRGAVRNAIAQAAGGGAARVDLDGVRGNLYPKYRAGWRSVQHLENHDVVRIDNTSDRQPRIARLGDASNARSWYARSRARVANGLLLTAPGIPTLFMGQEFLEDKYWSDNPGYFRDTLIWWDGLAQDRAMRDHLRFTADLIALRKRHPALRGDAINVFHVHDDNRVIAFHRWLEGAGRDVVVVASLREDTWWQYDLGFPRPGRWLEVFNSDVYDNWVNPQVAGNGGAIVATGTPRDGLPASATIVIPANAVLVFALDGGD